MRKIYLLFMIIFLLGCQPRSEYKKLPKVASPIFFTQNPDYTKNVADLLRDFHFYLGDNSKIILLDKPVQFKDIGHFLKDSTSCTVIEINKIIDEATYLSLIKFENNLGNRVSVVDTEEIYSLFKPGTYNGWQTFHKKYGASFMQIAHPIFFRENTYCILYLNYACGERCGEEQIRLYKKIGTSWILAKTGHGWIS